MHFCIHKYFILWTRNHLNWLLWNWSLDTLKHFFWEILLLCRQREFLERRQSIYRKIHCSIHLAKRVNSRAFFRKTQKERIDIVTIFYTMVWVSMPLRIWEIIGWILRGSLPVIWSSGSRKLVIKTELFSFISKKSCPLVFW